MPAYNTVWHAQLKDGCALMVDGTVLHLLHMLMKDYKLTLALLKNKGVFEFELEKPASTTRLLANSLHHLVVDPCESLLHLTCMTQHMVQTRKLHLQVPIAPLPKKLLNGGLDAQQPWQLLE